MIGSAWHVAMAEHGISGGIAIIVILILLVVVVVYVRKRRQEPEGRFGYVLSGKTKRFNPDKDLKSQISNIKYDVNRELPKSSFEIKEEIGSGNFGRVFKGELKALKKTKCKSTIAIKSISDNVDDNEIKNFLYEIKVMGYINPHLNLVSMIGCCTSELEETREVWLLLEFCDYGDLKHYLVHNKNKILAGGRSPTIDSRCLVRWAYDVAKGMHYLSESKIMHGDLAARNVLLDEDPLKCGYPIAKVADFGLSKKFYENITYEKESRTMVPWKWMALEYLKNDILTLKSDVWSYGVLFWEILSFGRVPYGHEEYNELLLKLENGYRLPCPAEVDNISSWSAEMLYVNVSKACFVEDCDTRGTFETIVKILEEELSEEEERNYTKTCEAYQANHANNYIKLGKTKSH